MSQEQQILSNNNNMFQVPLLSNNSLPIAELLLPPGSTNEIKSDVVIDLDENAESKLTGNEMNSVSGYVIYDELGNRHTMGEIWSEFKTIFVFVRSLLCFTSKEYVEDLALVPRESLKKAQVRLVVISGANWKHLKSFRQLTRFPYLLFSDPGNDLYNKLGMIKCKDLGKPGDSIHVKSSNLGGVFLHSMKRAITSSVLMDYQGGFDQQGGCLIVGPGPYLHFSHIDKNGRDHCPINGLLNKVGIQGINFPKSDNIQSKIS